VMADVTGKILMAIFCMVMSVLLVNFGFSKGKQVGYDRALADIKPIKVSAPQPTDQQCVSWLFDTNLKEAKKRICK